MLFLSLEIMPFAYYNECENSNNRWRLASAGECMRMRKISLLCLLLVLLAMVLGGCSENPEMSEEPTEMASAEVADAPTSEDPIADTDTSDDEEAEEDLVAAVEEVDFCVECHSDQTMLTQTADPEVEVESESEGEG
jgi:hypothetical protein